jgi:hypothetical protein
MSDLTAEEKADIWINYAATTKARYCRFTFANYAASTKSQRQTLLVLPIPAEGEYGG